MKISINDLAPVYFQVKEQLGIDGCKQTLDQVSFPMRGKMLEEVRHKMNDLINRKIVNQISSNLTGELDDEDI